jgi:hypothetical protein
MTFTISRKLLLGYLGMALIMILANLYAVNRLQDLNQADRSSTRMSPSWRRQAGHDTLLAMEMRKEIPHPQGERLRRFFGPVVGPQRAAFDLGPAPPVRRGHGLSNGSPEKEYEGLFSRKGSVAEQGKKRHVLSSEEGRKLMEP